MHPVWRWPSHRIGWWENFNRKAPFIFDGKKPWVSGEDVPQLNQSSDQVPVREHVLLADLQSLSADPSGTPGTQWVDRVHLETKDQPVDGGFF